MIQQILIFACLGLLLTATSFAGPREDVIKKLNQSVSTIGSEDAKSWTIFFEACINITPAPEPEGESFNMNTIWPGMPNWDAVSKWAESNEHLEAAFLETAKRALIGLPYGSENVPANFQDEGIVANIAVDGRLHTSDFSYINSVGKAYACATADTYRLFEIGETDRAIQFMISQLIVLRKFCDREFLKEQLAFMPMLGDALSNTRDMFFRYREKITATQFRFIAKDGIPHLETDATSLLMPEGDRVVGKALLLSLFDSTGVPDVAKFREVLSDIQADQELLSRAGAAKYWESIALIPHRGRDDSVKRLNLIYDDWWRRWKMRPFHPQLSIDTELEKSNPVKYAAVNLVIRDIEHLFGQRDLLNVEINSTAVSAALCGYKNHYGVYPSSIKKMYAQLLHRSSNLDALSPLPLRTDADWTLYSFPVGPFHYRRIEKKTKIDTKLGDVFLKKGECLLYSVAIDEEDHRGTDTATDIVLWPPIKTLKRNAGLLD